MQSKSMLIYFKFNIDDWFYSCLSFIQVGIWKHFSVLIIYVLSWVVVFKQIETLTFDTKNSFYKSDWLIACISRKPKI